MKIPEKIKFLSHTYTVRKREGYSNNSTKDNPERNRGMICYNDGIIDIDPAMFDSDQTFFHELQHMIADHMSIELNEKDVDRLAEGWLHVLKENDMLKQ